VRSHHLCLGWGLTVGRFCQPRRRWGSYSLQLQYVLALRQNGYGHVGSHPLCFRHARSPVTSLIMGGIMPQPFTGTSETISIQHTCYDGSQPHVARLQYRDIIMHTRTSHWGGKSGDSCSDSRGIIIGTTVIFGRPRGCACRPRGGAPSVYPY
jgi:hypothetical protein